MKEKNTIILGIGVVGLVISTFIFYVLKNEGIDLFDVLAIPILIVIIVFSIYVMHDKIKNLKAGLPSKDERLLNSSYKAGYYGFISAIWSAVGSNMLSIMLFDKELRGGLVVASVVLISGFVFITSYLYFSRKGD